MIPRAESTFCGDACRRAYARAVAAELAKHTWHTPANVIEAVHATMGSIDLDPASSPAANETVRATKIYTVKDDGLRQSWRCGRLFMNPPYGHHAPKFVKKFAASFEAGEIGQAILLLNTGHVNSKWFAPLRALQPIRCEPDHRLRFSGSGKDPAHGSIILGFGVDQAAFRRAFGGFGPI